MTSSISAGYVKTMSTAEANSIRARMPEGFITSMR